MRRGGVGGVARACDHPHKQYFCFLGGGKGVLFGGVGGGRALFFLVGGGGEPMQSNGFVNVLTAFSLDFLTSMICPFMSLISTSRLFLATSCDDKSVPCGSLPKGIKTHWRECALRVYSIYLYALFAKCLDEIYYRCF